MSDQYEDPRHAKDEDFDEDDEEISEDEAFNSEDEEKYGQFFTKSHRSTEEMNEEDEDDEEDGEGGDLLSDMLGSTPGKRIEMTNEEADDTARANLVSMMNDIVPKKQAKPVTEATELGKESEFGKSLGNDSTQLTLDALIRNTASVDAASTQTKNQLRDLNKASDVTGTLSAPLSRVQDERATRKVAYSSKSEEVGIFQPVVKANREKETLDFRSQLPGRQNLSNAALTSKFEAETDFEKSVQNLLQSSRLTDDRKIAEEEQLELEKQPVSKEEVLKRTKELAKLRSLMFQQEKKAKRVKKIKSKLYHKIRNQQAATSARKERENLRELDPELAEELDRQDAEKRAEERMTLKHNNTSKWVKHQLKRGINADESTRKAIAEQLQQGEKLRRKIETAKQDSDSSSDDEEDDEEDLTESDRLQRKLQKKTEALIMDIDAEAEKKNEGIHRMKFMQRAVEKQREKSKQQAQALLQELQQEDYYSDEEDTAESKPLKKTPEKVVISKSDKQAIDAILPEGSMQSRAVSGQVGHRARVKGAIAVDLGDDESENIPQVFTEQTGVKASKKKADADEDTPSTENPWIEPTTTSKKRKRSKSKKKEEATVDVQSAIQSISNMSKQKAPSPAQEKSAEPKDAKRLKSSKSGVADTPFSQQEELVNQAFAYADEDDAVNAIEKEKDTLASEEAEVKEGAEVARMMGVSGWGSWAGEGVKETKWQRQRKEKAERMAADAKKKALNKRKDAQMKNVLINEKKDKKAAKFMCSTVPYPFKTREQYELAMRNPLGSDWNTSSASKSLTAPRVIARVGSIIEPLKLTKDQKVKTKAQARSGKRKAKF